MTPRTRLALLGAAMAVLIVAIVITASSGNDKSDKSATNNQAAQGTTQGTTKTTKQTTVPKPQVKHIEVANAKPVGGITRISVEKGDRVRFEVTSDTADEVHVHGYDVFKDVPAGGSVRFNFPADIAGRFEIELEHHEEQIASLEVEP